jgi:superfamily II DNA or RNA helicase
VRLLAGDAWTEVADLGDGEAKMLDDYLAAEVPGFRNSPAYQRGVWDGREHLFDGSRFPTGFVRLVVELARRSGRACEVVDRRSPAPVARPVAGAAWLRPYQADAVEACLRRTRLVVQMPTGAGKSEVAVALGHLVPTPWLVLVDSLDLMDQMAARYEARTGERAGRIGGGVRDVRRFTVAMFQTLAERQDEEAAHLAAVGGVVVDEAQVVPADRNYGLLMSIPNARWRVGISATPIGRMDGRDHRTIGALGPVGHVVPLAQLVDAGVVPRARVRFVGHDCPPGTGTFAEVYEALVVLDEARNRLVCGIAAAAPRPTLVFVSRQDHGRALRAMMAGMGLRTEFVFGDTPLPGRRAALERVVRGDLDVLVAGKIFNKGVDVPELRGLVNAAAGRSAHDAVQRLGRGQRNSAGKDGFEFFDVDDRKNRWLRKHARERRLAYQAAGYLVEDVPDLRQLALAQ